MIPDFTASTINRPGFNDLAFSTIYTHRRVNEIELLSGVQLILQIWAVVIIHVTAMKAASEYQFWLFILK